MRLSDLDLLFLPGLGDTGPGHWLTRWEKKLSTARLIAMPGRPCRDEWAARIVDAMAQATRPRPLRPVVFIAHDLGCNALAAAAPFLAGADLRGAFLVAPATQARIAADPAIDAAFGQLPAAPLPFPSLCAASATDPRNPLALSEAWAAAIGARFIGAGDAGGIDDASGHGPWPEGLLSLAGFLRGL